METDRPRRLHISLPGAHSMNRFACEPRFPGRHAAHSAHISWSTRSQSVAHRREVSSRSVPGANSITSPVEVSRAFSISMCRRFFKLHTVSRPSIAVRFSSLPGAASPALVCSQADQEPVPHAPQRVQVGVEGYR